MARCKNAQLFQLLQTGASSITPFSGQHGLLTLGFLHRSLHHHRSLGSTRGLQGAACATLLVHRMLDQTLCTSRQREADAMWSEPCAMLPGPCATEGCHAVASRSR